MTISIDPVTMPCGCTNHVDGRIAYCPLHAAAPALLAFVQKRVTDYETSLAKCSPYARAHTIARGEPESVREARALLARLGG